MGLDIWFREDIRNAILAADEASGATVTAIANQDARTLDLIAEKLREELPEGTSRVLLDALHAAAVSNTDVIKHYRRGYRAALGTLALAFGLFGLRVGGGVGEQGEGGDRDITTRNTLYGYGVCENTDRSDGRI